MKKLAIITESKSTVILEMAMQRTACFAFDTAIYHSLGEYLSSKEEHNLVVSTGNELCSHLTGEKLSNVRGTILPSKVNSSKVLPTIDLDTVRQTFRQMFTLCSDLNKAKMNSLSNEMVNFSPCLIIKPSFAETVRLLGELIHGNVSRIALDIETDMVTYQPTHIGFAWTCNDAMSLKLNSYSPTEEVEVLSLISQLMTHPSKQLIMHNACYDISVLYKKLNLLCTNLWMDTMLGMHSCFIEMEKDLGYTASILLNVPAWKHLAGDDKEVYNALDCCHTWALAHKLEKLITQFNAQETFNIEMSEINPVIFMGLKGIKINRVLQEEVKKELTEKTLSLEKSINTLIKSAGFEEINIRSPAQLKELLYTKLNLPPQTNRKTGALTTDETALSKLFQKTKNPILEQILSYRELNKILTTYVDIDLDLEDKVYTSYNIGGTDTGRWSSSRSAILPFGSGNLQNIPKDGLGSIVRKMFIPSQENFVFLEADFIQAEAVIVAYLINDERLIQAFRSKEDIHKLTASMMFNVQVEQITDPLRKIGKLIRHAMNYSAGPKVLSAAAEIALPVAKYYLELFHKMCPQLAIWHESIRMQLKTSSTLITPLGRKRKFYDRYDDSTFRGAYAYIPQSTVADLTNMSLVKFYENFGHKWSLVLQAHDAIMIECPAEQLKEAAEALKSCMTWEVKINNKIAVLDVDFKSGKNWKELEKYTL